jgi:membrane protein implicated in regulation of membrane protease activity
MSIPIFWFLIGTALVLIEVFAIPGLGFLFAGLGAITLGGLVTYGIIAEASLATQIAYFFLFTSIWAAILWVPLRKFSKKSKSKQFENLKGTYGTVESKEGLIAGKIGYIKWSGAKMRAAIREGSTTNSIQFGENVWVHDQVDGVLQVDVEKA